MYSGLPIYSETRDLCDMATCPIKTGPLQINFDQYLPPIVSLCACMLRSASHARTCSPCVRLVALHPSAKLIYMGLQVPPGPYNVTLDAKAENGAELLCLQVLFEALYALQRLCINAIHFQMP